jgi:hypothetical protein
MGRHERRASAARARSNRVAQFRQQSAGGGYETSLRAAGEHRPCDAQAINNWFLSEQSRRPSCFGCRAQFSPTRRPGGFLCATASRAPGAGTAVAGLCSSCWNDRPADKIERAAVEVMRRQLGARGFAEDQP